MPRSYYISPDKFSSEKISNWTIEFLSQSITLIISIYYLDCRILICFYIVNISSEIDKRSSGYKRRIEALIDKPTATLNLVKQTLSQGIAADYLLMDSWFTEAPLIKEVMNEGLDVIGMVKKTSKRFYQYKGKKFPLQTLITHCNVNQKIFSHQEGSLGSIQVKLNNGIPVKIVFIRHRKYKTEWLAILSTNTSLSDEEIIRIYVIVGSPGDYRR